MHFVRRSLGVLSVLFLCALFVRADDALPLHDRLLSSSPAVRLAATKELSAMTFYQKKVIAEGLQSALESTSQNAQSAAEVLAGMGDAAEPALPGLVAALHYDEETTAKPVEDALVGIGADVVPSLRSVLGDSNFFVRRRAAVVLGRLGPRAKSAAPDLVRLLNDSQYDVSNAAQASLLQIGEAAIPAVLTPLHQANEQGRASLLELLGKLGPASSPVIIGSLARDESSYVRVAAAQALATLQPVPSDAIAALILSMSDLDERVREADATALSDLGEQAKPAIGVLIVASKTDEEPIVRQGAQDALTSIGPAVASSIPGMSRAMRSPNEDVHEAVITTLATAKVTFAHAQDILTTALRDSSPSVRLKAVETASALSGRTAVAMPFFRSALTDPDPDVKAAATKALAKTESQSPDPTAVLQNALKGDDPTTRQAAVHALGQMGISAVPAIVPGLKDPNKDVSDEASRALVAMGPDAIEPLQAYSDSSDLVLKTRTAELIAIIRKNAPSKLRHKKHSSS